MKMKKTISLIALCASLFTTTAYSNIPVGFNKVDNVNLECETSSADRTRTTISIRPTEGNVYWSLKGKNYWSEITNAVAIPDRFKINEFGHNEPAGENPDWTIYSVAWAGGSVTWSGNIYAWTNHDGMHYFYNCIRSEDGDDIPQDLHVQALPNAGQVKIIVP
jgi:hypothetical protein